MHISRRLLDSLDRFDASLSLLLKIVAEKHGDHDQSTHGHGGGGGGAGASGIRLAGGEGSDRTIEPLDALDIPGDVLQRGEKIAGVKGHAGKVVQSYVQDSRPLNTSLREKEMEEYERQGHYKYNEKDVKAMDEITSAAVDPPLTVYRGIEGGSLTMAEEALKTGASFRDPAFMSSSLDAEKAGEFSYTRPPTVLQIVARRGGYVSKVEGYPEPSVHEFVLPRNASMRVVGIDRRVKIGKKKYNVIRMEMVE